MKNLETAELLDRLNWRYACKKFDASRKIGAGEWQALEQALILTPSSYGLQPWKFFVVQSPELRQRLRAVSWDQSQIEDCSHLVVFARRKTVDGTYIDHHLERLQERRGLSSERVMGIRNFLSEKILQGKSPEEIPDWNARQVYIALGNFMTSAALLGIDTCPLEGLDPAQYDKILGLEESGYESLCACAAGFRAADDSYSRLPKVRFDNQELIETL